MHEFLYGRVQSRALLEYTLRVCLFVCVRNLDSTKRRELCAIAALAGQVDLSLLLSLSLSLSVPLILPLHLALVVCLVLPHNSFNQIVFPQFHSHLLGALNTGSTLEEIRVILDLVEQVCKISLSSLSSLSLSLSLRYLPFTS
jgi:alkylhydroperoxidase/carboxymuconolactone decarboxylase family protein YurZ